MQAAAAWTGSEFCSLGLPAGGMMDRLLGWLIAHQIAAPEPGDRLDAALATRTASRVFRR